MLTQQPNSSPYSQEYVALIYINSAVSGIKNGIKSMILKLPGFSEV